MIPTKRFKNIDIMYNEIGANHMQINSIRVNKSKQPQQKYGIANIKDLSHTDNHIDSIET